jgi:protease I
MPSTLDGKKVAILATDGVEQVEFTKPRDALLAAGATVSVLSITSDPIQGFHHLDKGDTFPVDLKVSEAQVGDYDALVLPGGVANPDFLRTDDDAVAFVHDFFEQGKPVAAICHGPWMLVEAEVVRGRKVTSWPSLETDLRNAGAEWVDQEVVVDQGLVTSRNPDDLPPFCSKLVEEIAEGSHVGQHAWIRGGRTHVRPPRARPYASSKPSTRRLAWPPPSPWNTAC